MTMKFLANVPFVTYMSAIMKATSDDDKPIPGYLYGEISKISLESAENCETLVDCLVERLQRDSTHVKLKVLKLMKYVVENGHPNFRLGLLKKSTGIKEATKHSGTPDPLHGNVPYVMVRKTAQSLSEMLFNLDTVSTSTSQHETTISTVGIGSDSRGMKTKPSKMEGFGNTSAMQQNKSLGDNIREGLFHLVDRLGESTNDERREVLSTLEGNSGYIPPQDNSHHVSPTCMTSQQHTHTTLSVSPPRHVPGKAGGGWDDSDDDDDDGFIDEQSSTKQRTSKSDTSSTAGTLDRSESAVQQDFTSEQNLVNEMIKHADINFSVLLKRSQLKEFVKNCANMNCDKVVEFLEVHLLSTTDQHVMRSLMLIESLMNTDLVNLDRVTLVCKDAMLNVVEHKTGQTQLKAEKLIRILEKLSSQHSLLDDGYRMVSLRE